MRITQSRLLQIIREEVELHERNTFILDENFFQEEDMTNKEKTDAIEDEIEADEEAGNLDEIELDDHKINNYVVGSDKSVNLDSEVEEDRLFTKSKPHKVIQPKKQNDI